jgi:hypothetical protein
MIIFTIPIAVVIGILISRKYAPKTKSEKIWASILIPLISGVFINFLVASYKNSGLGFMFDFGSTLLFVAIPEVALLITLFASLEVGGKKKWSDTSTMKLHYGTGENRVDFEVTLTQKEILQMAKLREQNPERWKDNELELVKTVKKEVNEVCVIEKESDNKETIADNKTENKNVGRTLKVEDDRLPTVRDNEDDNQIEIESNQPKEMEKKIGKEGLFGNKLESEYRRESIPEAHWIRQNGTEMCLNIDEITYKRMIELQNENPEKWVNNEFNLYLQATSGRHKGNKRKRTWKMKKWMWIVVIIFGLCTIYGVVARVVDNTVATCNEEMMQGVYESLKYQEYVSCSYPTFRYRMIANSLYRKKMYNLYPKYVFKWEGAWTEKPCRYEDYVFNLHRNKWLENPFVWLW